MHVTDTRDNGHGACGRPQWIVRMSAHLTTAAATRLSASGTRNRAAYAACRCIDGRSVHRLAAARRAASNGRRSKMIRM